MRLTTSWLLSAFVATASATSDASVYLLQHERVPAAPTPPTLSPEQARLVLAQRLGVSKYHSIQNANEATISHINQFGGVHQTLFGSDDEESRSSQNEVVIMIDGVSADNLELLSKALGRGADFYLSSPPLKNKNAKLVDDLSTQLGHSSKCEINTEDIEYCWTSPRSSIHHYDLSKASDAAKILASALGARVHAFVNSGLANVIVVLIPAASASKSAYGVYDMPKGSIKRRQFEEPISYSFPSSQEKNERVSTLASNSSKPIRGVLPSCFSSMDLCNQRTNNCSGHGKCYKKRGNPSGGQACFACGCSATNQTFTHGSEGSERRGVRLIYWGGAACQKQDVSGPFWLLAIFTIVGVGLITWAISLMYSVGEEKLPGVIGAGVSNNRAK